MENHGQHEKEHEYSLHVSYKYQAFSFELYQFGD